MSEMVERVASVFAAEIMELTADQRKQFVFPDDCNGDTIERARSSARQILEVMRAPTKSMVEALNAQGGDTDAIWPAMIEAALNG
jgi:hypothetical protein